jgi:hypothetical protein
MFQLKHVFQRKLHDPRIQRIADLAEGIAIDRNCGIHGAEAVHDVVGFRTKLKLLIFADLKFPRQ